MTDKNRDELNEEVDSLVDEELDAMDAGDDETAAAVDEQLGHVEDEIDDLDRQEGKPPEFSDDDPEDDVDEIIEELAEEDDE